MKKWREGKVRPIPGNAPHDRPVSRGISFSLWRVCDDPYPATTILRRSVCVFQAWRNLSVRCGPKQDQTLGGSIPPHAGRPPAQVKERTVRSTPFSSSAMSSGRLFLDRVGRHQSPSPLHRHEQTNTYSSGTRAKGDVSTLPARGHFYFALTVWKAVLIPPSANYIIASGRSPRPVADHRVCRGARNDRRWWLQVAATRPAR